MRPPTASDAVMRAPRDLRLDFFRGLGMFIIFIAHTPGNWWTLWIPARFGFSDATEIFVFCSGMASAIAFGRVFELHGWWIGAGRVIYRIWQVYWAHIGLFLAVTAMLVVFNDLALTERNYIARLNLVVFFKNPQENLLGLLTLTYVPNYFDILPMYLGILVLLPIVVALARLNPAYAGAFIAVIWLLANFKILALPAEPWSERKWFFNPFGWQLVFFTGFAFVRGWIKPPPIDRRLVIAAIVIILVTVPVAYFRLWREFSELRELRTELKPLTSKSSFGILRYVHFLALAYLAWAAAGEAGRRLQGTGIWGRFVTVVRRVGQQSLAVFVVSLVIAQFMAFMLDITGKSYLTVAAANCTGFALLIAVAYSVRWFKSEPWRKPPPEPLAKT
ncbi:MAG: OpgC domain-containing protein [Rhizobiales bacterium]|nr:OpgC domain-containing protein [Hyphomicrobiales bacterium]